MAWNTVAQLRALRATGRLSCLIVLATGTAAFAGPPFLTDDPELTDTGHWEIFGPLIEAEGDGGVVAGSIGAEFNYGAAPNLQLTLGIPTGYARSAGENIRWGTGDIEISAKYRVLNIDDAGLQLAVFPGLSLPTAGNGMGSGHVTALLPVWLQKDSGAWSAFGGGGYAINPGAGNRNYWTGGIAVSRQVSRRLLVGVEADRQGASEFSGRGATSLGLGAIYQLPAPYRLLASGGPTFGDGPGLTGYHAFLALGLDF